MVSDCRDIFLSHRSTDKNFVRDLAADIERQQFDGRLMLTWVDEAEIKPGSSIVGMMNRRLGAEPIHRSGHDARLL